MRSLFKLFFCILPFSVNTFAQDCGQPMTQPVFQAAFNQVAVQPDNNAKLMKAMGFLNNSCMLSAQVKQMSMLFNNDAPRFEYCKAAYAHVYDPANFYDVYDAFTKFSDALKLHDYVQSVVVNTPHQDPNPNFPNLNYPSPVNYNGKKGCQGPGASDAVFADIARNVNAQPTDEAKVVAIKIAAGKNCLSMAMAMKLATLIANEGNRLQMMKDLFPMLFDLENYNPAQQVFTAPPVKTEWLVWAQNFLVPPPPPCLVSDDAFKKLMKDFEDKHFSDEKMKMFEVVNKDRCFSTEQVRTISKQFPFGEEKMKVFKACFASCTDRSNYYKLTDELSFSSEKDQLTNYIKTH